ncbi:hypothetical protein [Streptomyces lincolnensis]|uniref:hypothetical protein n=1 Tax=Streptomyces lincolnensis TaxID=1915 RepID=UPI0037D09791
MEEWVTSQSALPEEARDASWHRLTELGREPFFAGVSSADLESADLELVGHRALDDRVLLIEYRPTGGDIPRV